MWSFKRYGLVNERSQSGQLCDLRLSILLAVVLWLDVDELVFGCIANLFILVVLILSVFWFAVFDCVCSTSNVSEFVEFVSAIRLAGLVIRFVALLSFGFLVVPVTVAVIEVDSDVLDRFKFKLSFPFTSTADLINSKIKNWLLVVSGGYFFFNLNYFLCFKV